MQKNILSSLELFRNAHLATFMQDNAPCHKTKAVSYWFTEIYIKVFEDWPRRVLTLTRLKICGNTSIEIWQIIIFTISNNYGWRLRTFGRILHNKLLGNLFILCQINYMKLSNVAVGTPNISNFSWNKPYSTLLFYFIYIP